MKIHQTIAFIRQELTSTWHEYQSWFELSPELLAYRPSAGWSIEQVLEHVTLTNYFLLILIRKGKKKALELALQADWAQALTDDVHHLEALGPIAEHKSFGWARPEHMEPKGDKSLSEVRLLLKEQIDECQAILDDIPNGEGILYKTTMTVNALGKIDVYQYIYFLCQHAKRHVTQMQRVKEQFDGHSAGN